MYDKNAYKQGMSIEEYNKAFDEYYKDKITFSFDPIEYKADKEIDPDEFNKLFGDVVK
jgi:hypothetical protein